MTPAERAALITRAKALAIPVASCVRAGIRPDHLIGDASRDLLAALVIVLAESADPVRLRAVTAAAEDGPDVTDLDVSLRVAHRQVNRLRERRRPVPVRLAALESQYQRRRREARAAEDAA